VSRGLPSEAAGSRRFGFDRVCEVFHPRRFGRLVSAQHCSAFRRFDRSSRLPAQRPLQTPCAFRLRERHRTCVPLAFVSVEISSRAHLSVAAPLRLATTLAVARRAPVFRQDRDDLAAGTSFTTLV